MKHIFELRMKDQIEERSSQLLRNLSSCEKKAWKKFRIERDSNPWPLRCHSFIHPSRVYYQLTIWPAPSWLDSSVGGALHRHRRGHGFESRSSLNFFQAFFSQLLKLRSNCEDLSSICISIVGKLLGLFVYLVCHSVRSSFSSSSLHCSHILQKRKSFVLFSP